MYLISFPVLEDLAWGWKEQDLKQLLFVK